MNNQIYHLVYLTTNLVNGKIYVGVHSTHKLNDGYLGSGTAISHAIKKYGSDNFSRQILHFCLTEAQSLSYESMIVDQCFIDRKDTYNIKLGGGNKVAHTDEIKQKISIKATGRILSEATRQKMSHRMTVANPFKGKRHTDITHQLIVRKSMATVANRSPEEQLRINKNNGDSNRGKRRSKEFCELISGYRSNQFPPKAEKFLCIDPFGSEFIVHGEFKKFIKEHDLSISLFRRFEDNGKIYGKQKTPSIQVSNSIGWEIKRL